MAMAANAIFSDLQALSGMRVEARKAPDQSLEQVASQFESLFMHMMLKAMRDATPKSELFSSHSLDMSQQMFDQQISLELSQKGGLGLAEILVEQLRGGVGQLDQNPEEHVSKPPINLTSSPGTPLPAGSQSPGWLKAMQATDSTALSSSRETLNQANHRLSTKDQMGIAQAWQGDRWQPETPEAFIRGVWSHAVSAAQDIGVNPEVLVAQSALETGWGRRVIKKTGGDSSFNLFGIKADNRWQGESARVKTIEFREGVAVQENAAFRAYDSLASAFDDYVQFLKSSPRYEQALDNAGNDKGFLYGLQQAGYATDPKYAEKILSILGREKYASVINELKNSQNWSLYH